jgi:hypothetical protein
MGFARQPSRQTIQASKVVTFIGEREIGEVLRASDPFAIEDACAVSPNGLHQAIGSCGDVVCCHCARIFWS